MFKILKIFRKASQNNCLINIVHIAITQLAQDNTGTSREGPLKALTFGTYRGPPRDSLETSTKICGL